MNDEELNLLKEQELADRKKSKWSETQEYKFQLALTWARMLRRKMIETGKTLFRVKREGSSATDTKYTFEPIE